MTSKQLLGVAWALSLAVLVMAVFVWVDASGSRVRFTALSFFPLLGLVAFSLMWVHYVIGGLRRYFDLSKNKFKPYYNATAAVVLVALLLHPGLLIYRLWRGGYGLPPKSYLNYVVPSAKWAVLLGSISLVVFLLFELRRKFGNKSWWRWVELAQILAMTAVYFHALRLGGELRVEWYRTVWYFYGVTFAMAIAYTYFYEFKKARVKE